MNGPDNTGEQSMEEILASIRQIIAEEPSTQGAASVIEKNPLVPRTSFQIGSSSGEQASSSSASTSSSSSDDARSPALLDRLNGVLKNGTLPPTNPLGSKRPLSFDQDLADMLDDEVDADTAAVAAPKPDLRVPPVFSNASEPAAEPDHEPAANGASAHEPEAVPAQPFVPSLPFGAKEAEVVAPPPRNFGFPPLKKQGFFPPQKTLPPFPRMDMEGAPAKESANAAVASAPAVNGAAGRFVAASGFGSAATVAAQPMAATKPDATLNNATFDTATGDTAGFMPRVEPAAMQATDMPADDGAGVTAGRASVEAATSSSAAAGSDPFVMPAEPAPQPAAAATFNGSAYGNGSRPHARPDPRFVADTEPSVVAAHALDALAQGLAAAAVPGVGRAQAAATIPLMPVIEPEPAIRSANALAPAIPPAAPIRTLEDAIADMLRPMLQQWVADNMPRIIEKALRVEVANTTKKPPGG